MREAPSLEVSVFSRHEPNVGAQAGPLDTWDFEPLVRGVLAQLRSIPIDDVPFPTLHCVARYRDSTPSFVLTRLTVGELVSLGASVQLILLRRDDPISAHQGDLPRLRADFALETRSEIELDEITKRIGLRPTSQRHKGAPRRTGEPFPRTIWMISTPESPAESFDPLLKDLLGQLEPHSQAISELTRDEANGVVSLVGSFSQAAPIVRLRADDLRIVRRLGAEIDVDLIESRAGAR